MVRKGFPEQTKHPPSHKPFQGQIISFEVGSFYTLKKNVGTIPVVQANVITIL